MPHAEASPLGGLPDFIGKEPRHTPDEMHRKIGAAVRTDTATEKAVELPPNQCSHIRMSPVGMKERDKRSQITVCLRLTVDVFQQAVLCQSCFGQELPSENLVHLSLEHFRHPSAPQDSTTPLIAKDVAQRGNLRDKTAAVIQTTSRPCAEDADNAFLAAAQSMGSTEQVGMHTDCAHVHRKLP